MTITSFLDRHSTKIEAAQVTAARFVLLPVEHVLQRLRVAAQNKPGHPAISSVRKLIRSKGFIGIFDGGKIYCGGRVFRELTQRPLQGVFTNFYRSIVPESVNKDYFVSNLLTGVTYSCVAQTLVGLPFERLFIEQTVKKGYAGFFSRLRGQSPSAIVASLYVGGQMTCIRGASAWTIFNVAQYCAQQIIHKVDREEKHPTLTFTFSVISTSSLVTGTLYPIEFARSRILMRPKIVKNGTIKAVKELFARYGLRGMYTGASIMWLHNCVQITYLKFYQDMLNRQIDARKQKMHKNS